jgi:OFA family oxalate/formate antiporter-like MFS transporter
MISLAPALAKRVPFYYGWVVVSVAGLVSFSSVSFTPGIVSTMFLPMSEHFGWSRSVVPGAIFTGALMVIIVGPLSGRLMDRYGSRMVISSGMLIMALCILGLGFVNSLVFFYIVFGLGYSVFMGVFRVALSATAAQWFVRRRGTASAVISSSAAAGFVVLPLVVSFFIGIGGWRAGWMSIGTIALMLAVPASFLLLKAHPADVGQRVDGARTADEEARTSRLGRSATVEVQWTVREAIRTPTLWMLVAGLSIQGLSSSGLNIHLIPHLMDRGISQNVAVLSFTIGGATMVAAGFFWGPLTDRIETRYVFGLASFVLIGYMIAIMTAFSAWSVVPIGLLMGVGYGGNALVMRVGFANYFGRRSVGAIQGFVTPFQVLVAGSGALISGLLYDAFGTYMVAFLAFVVLMVVALVVVLLVPTPVKRDEHAQVTTA